MIQDIKDLYGCKLAASDGEFGRARDISLAESMRWKSVPGSAGDEDPGPPGEVEEARNESAKLVDLGALEAERDSLLRAEEWAKLCEARGR